MTVSARPAGWLEREPSLRPTLFDTHDLHPSDPRAVVTRQARARRADPATSRLAAQCVNKGNESLVGAIRWFVNKRREPVDAFKVAAALCGTRWSYQTVLSGVSRAGLTVFDENGASPRGRSCTRYSL